LDYDWFRSNPVCSTLLPVARIESHRDRTHFTYAPHTLVEPTFLSFLAA